MKNKQSLIILILTLSLCGCSSNLDTNNDSKEYKPSFIYVDSNTVSYKIAISNNEQIETELQAEKDYKNRVNEYNDFKQDTKTNITEIMFNDSQGEVDWTETENGDIIYNDITFTDLKTNVNKINHSKYTSREIIDFIVHSFKTEDKIVFSRIDFNDEYSEESTSIFLDQFIALKEYKEFVENHNNENINWQLSIYTYAYQHAAYLYGSSSYVVSLSTVDKDIVNYTVQSHEPEQPSTEISTEETIEVSTEEQTEISTEETIETNDKEDIAVESN